MKQEIEFDTKSIIVQLRAAKDAIKNDYYPLVTLQGGIDKMTIKQEQTKAGLKTTIQFVTDDGSICLDTPSFDRAQQKREIAATRLKAKQATPV